MNSCTDMDQIGKYWGMWGARRSGGSSSTASPISAWAAAYGSSEPSWEEQAFAHDAAAHLGGCVWPPRSYSCTFCQREFRSAQALGGHMNVHRRDRALLRQGGSSFPEEVHAPNDQPQQGALLYRAASSNPSTTTTPTSTAGACSAAKGDANTTTPPTSYLSAIIKESKNKHFITPMPDSVETKEDQVIHQCDPDDADQSARKKRRRLDHPLAAALLIFVQPAAKATDVTGCESQGLRQGADHDTKVPKTTIPSPSSSFPLLDQPGLDLELRLGTTPKVT